MTRRTPRRAIAPRATAPRPTEGFTLVEVIVAIAILSIGLLALAGLAGAAAIAVRGGRNQVVAAAVAQSRFDSLASVPCRGLAPGSVPTAGTAVTRSVQESWVVTDERNVKRLADTIRFAGRSRPLVYLSVIPCRD